jgi:hypothetical protein
LINNLEPWCLRIPIHSAYERKEVKGEIRVFFEEAAHLENILSAHSDTDLIPKLYGGLDDFLRKVRG